MAKKYIPTSTLKSNSSIKRETNDCVVCAVAFSFDMDYDTAHKFTSKIYKREKRKGVRAYPFHRLNDVIVNDGISFNGKTLRNIKTRRRSSGKTRGITVGTFVKLHPVGSFLMSVRGHSFAIKDSIIHGNPEDYTKKRVIVERAWEVIDGSKDKMSATRIKKDRLGSLAKKGDYCYGGRLIKKISSNKWVSNRHVKMEKCGSGFTWKPDEEFEAKSLKSIKRLIDNSWVI